MLIQITACQECGANDKPIQGAALPHRGGVLVGWFCAACAIRIEADERARLKAQDDTGEIK